MAKVESFRSFPKPVVKKSTKGEPRALLAYVKVHGKQFAKEFPLSTRASAILAWQEEEYARRESQLGSSVLRMPGPFAHDVERYLDLPAVLDMPSFGSRSCDIRAWIPQFNDRLRTTIKDADVSKVMLKWKREGVAGNTRRHRLTALKDLWVKLDKRDAPWAAEVKAPAKTQLVPQALDYDTIITTLNYMEPSLAKACALIMAWCGFRPVEIRRTEKWMVKLTGDVPQVIRKTAKGGILAAMPLTPEAILGWEMFDAHGGWEAAIANINRDWRAAMERAGFPPVKVYALVHSFCTQLYASSGDVQMVQKARGHADIRTTLVYTQLVADPRLAGEMKRAFSADLAKR